MSNATTFKDTLSRGGAAVGHLLHYILLNDCIITYFSTVQPQLLARLEARPETQDIALGVGLLGLQGLEMVGLWLKYPLVKRWIKASPAPASLRAIGSLCTAWAVMGHLGITLVISLVIYDAFGLGATATFIPALLGVVFIILLLLKDFVFLLSLDKYASQGPASGSALAIGQRFPRLSATLANWLLMAFSVVAYTVTWEKTAVIVKANAAPAYRIVEYFGGVLAFCLLYAAARPLSVVEAWMIQRPWLMRLVSTITFLVTMVSAIASKYPG